MDGFIVNKKLTVRDIRSSGVIEQRCKETSARYNIKGVERVDGALSEARAMGRGHYKVRGLEND